MYLFRIHIRPQGGTDDMQVTFDYCLKHSLLGVGWRTESRQNTKDWDAFLSEAAAKYDNLQVCAYIHRWVSEGDLVWTRDMRGRYYLARVESGWEYWTTDDAENSDIDIANIFRCKIKPVAHDMVPGKVVACFRATRTMQEIADPKALEYSKFLWNKLANEARYHVDGSLCSDIFLLLDSEETEDLVFLYLQHKGWHVVPNSRKADTMSFEYSAVDPKTGDVALTQVKTGGTVLNRDDYRQYSNRVFLFQSNGLYGGTDASNVTCISREELTDFLQSCQSWLPAALRNKYEIVRGFKTS